MKALSDLHCGRGMGTAGASVLDGAVSEDDAETDGRVHGGGV